MASSDGERRLEHVDKVYPDGTRALATARSTVADGELLVLVGPSGCGKSTLLRLLAGLEDADRAATLRIGDARRERPAAAGAQRRDGVPGLRALPAHDGAREPRVPARACAGSPRAEMRPARRSGRPALLEHRSAPRSAAAAALRRQRQRVAMGRALVREPAVFLLDEPLSNLDAKLRVEVRAEIAELQRRTAHDDALRHPRPGRGDDARRPRRRAHAGRLQQVATPRELYERPANVFVAGFIGNPPMNLFPLRVSMAAGGSAVELAGQPSPARVDGALAALLGPLAGDGALTGGIRPEALTLAPDAGDGTLRAHVEHVEALGHETLAPCAPTAAGDRRMPPV